MLSPSGFVYPSLSIRYYTPHAATRARQRHGLECEPEDWRQAVLRIIAAVLGERSGASLIRPASDEVEVWSVLLRGQVVPVAYRPEWARIVTVLPRGVDR